MAAAIRASTWRSSSGTFALGLSALQVALLCAASTPSFAQLTQTDAEKAQAYVDLAKKLFQAGDFAGALDGLKRAEPVLTDSEARHMVRYNIARCHEELGHPVEAVRAYQYFLSEASDEARRKKAADAIERLAPDAFGRLKITCDPPGAMVFDSQLWPEPVACPVERDRVLVGTYDFEITHPERKAQTRTVEVHPSASTELAVVFPTPATVPLPEAPPPEKRPPEEAQPTPEETPRGEPNWIPWIALGSGGALLATGAVFNAVASGESGEIADMPPSDEREQKVADFETNRILALSGYVLGAIGAGFGGYLLLTDSGSASSAGVSVEPGAVSVRW